MSLAKQAAHYAKWNFHLLLDAWRDRRLGINASGQHEKGELDSSGPNAVYSHVYLGTPHVVLDIAFHLLRIDPTRFAFVDVGSGKGRVVVRAAGRPFRRVEGVELSPKMHRIALENIEKADSAGRLRSKPVVHNVDAVEYVLPETPLVIFFFNAFERGVLVEFATRLERSLRDRPRECLFVYLNPRNGACLEERGFEKLQASRLTLGLIRLLSPWPIAVYRSSPPAPDGPAGRAGKNRTA